MDLKNIQTPHFISGVSLACGQSANPSCFPRLFMHQPTPSQPKDRRQASLLFQEEGLLTFRRAPPFSAPRRRRDTPIASWTVAPCESVIERPHRKRGGTRRRGHCVRHRLIRTVTIATAKRDEAPHIPFSQASAASSFAASERPVLAKVPTIELVDRRPAYIGCSSNSVSLSRTAELCTMRLGTASLSGRAKRSRHRETDHVSGRS